jgi:outer membrane receptor protein involved in Fe transport
MRKFGLLGTSALRSAAFIGLSVALASPAFAQEELDADQEQEGTLEGEVEVESGEDTDTAAGADETIIVTGSRIRRPNLTSTVPITSVGPEEVLQTADVSLGDALNDLPSLRSTFSQTNSTRFIGTAGLNWLDLRGLGVVRTLVLVNGRRHITSTPGDYLVDVNVIPSDLVDRIDIVTGGNSAIYGSDAVAGVVNFILKRNFDGIRVRGQAGITDNGDRGSYFTSVTAGRNFADDRGNIAIALEYAKANPLYFRDRPFEYGSQAGRCQFNVAEPQGAAGGETGPSASDNIPDNQFFCGIRNGGLSTSGTIGGLSATQFLRFNRAGDLFVDTVQTSFIPFGSGNVIGGDPGAGGTTLRETGQVAAGLDRYMANLLFSFEVAPAFRPFLEAKYVHVDAVQEGQPSFFQGQLNTFFSGAFGIPVPNIRCDNPFLTAQNITTLRGVGLCGGAAAFNPAATIPISRFNTDFGGRGELHDRDTYRIVGGFDGDFNDDWRYEVAVNYGRLETFQRSLNNLYLRDINGNLAGFSRAIDATRNASGQIVCRINADASTTNDDPACVPINIFGFGRMDQAALNYVNTTATREEWAEEFVASAFLSGDLSQLFELPGGPIGFAVGAEYRTEDSFSQWDPLTRSGGTFLNAIQTFDPPKLKVKEAFGEIRIPVLKDLPFAHELTLEAAARYSDYNLGNTNSTFAYNLGGTFAPTPDLRLRANYSKSVRVPTQTDLFSPFSQNFAFIADPCDAVNITNNPNRAANCQAAGVPPTANAASSAVCATTAFPNPVGQPFINCLARAFSTGFFSGGNPNLEEETGKSLTIGGVFTPRFLPGFSLSVDYYNIKVDNLIAVLGAQAIINQCYDEESIQNPFCATVSRDPATGFFNNPAVLAAGVNFAAQRTEGIDFDIAYRRNFQNGHRLSLRGIATYVLKLNNFTNPANPALPNRQLSELGDPQFAASFNASYGWDAYTLSYNLRYIGKQTISTYEAQHSFNGNPPTNADVTAEVWYPDVFYHNVRMSIKVNERFTFYGGVDNLMDRMPPFGLLGTGGGDPFDPIGRQFYFGATIDF